MQGSVLQHDLRKVISIVDLLRDIGLDKQLSLPKVVVLGNQSSGKSSLLQQIVGLDFLPRGSGVVTRRPLQLRMNNNPTLKEPYAEFDQVTEGGKKKRFTDFDKVRATIDEVTQKVCGKQKIIIDNPIILNVFSSSCPNLTVVDLPGITSIPVGDQPKNIYQLTKDMALRYIKEPRSIILCVIPANQDLSTSQALKVMRQIDPAGQRSIGCLTKIDIMNRGDDARSILKNQEIPLRYGYVGIKNRCQQDVVNKVPVAQSLKQQMKFFTTSPIYSTLPPGTFGTEALTSKLTSILYQQIKSTMPEIFEQIKRKRQESQQQLQKLGPGVVSTDAQMVNYAWKSISTFLRIYLNSINGIKNTDYKKDPITAQLREELTGIYKQQYEEPATQQLSDKDIQRAMINFPGDSTIPGFPSIDAFLALLNPLLKKLQTPAYQVNNRIHEIMEHEARDIIDEVMIKKFPEFNVRFLELVRRVLQKHRRDLELYLNSLLDAELTYLYTNDASYLMNDFNITAQEKKKLQSGKIKDPLIFELRKRIDSYYKLVVRNLRDLIPKQIFNFLISKCLKQLQFEAFQFTSDVNKLKEWLNEPAQVKNRRKECLKAIKVFEQSEKKIRMDPQISKLIKNTKKQSKYYHKFGMKTPQEQQQIELEKQKKLYESKAQQAFRRSSIHENKNADQKRGKSRGDKKGGDSKGGATSKEQAPKNVRQDSSNSSSTNQSNQSKKTSDNNNPSPNNATKGNAMFNMFGQNVNDKKKEEPVVKPPTTVNKDKSADLFGTPSPNMTKNNAVGEGQIRSPNGTNKRNTNFNFEDAWKAESKPASQQQQFPPVNQPKQTINPPKPPEPVKNNDPPKGEDNKKRATFNNLFGLK